MEQLELIPLPTEEAKRTERRPKHYREQVREIELIYRTDRHAPATLTNASPLTSPEDVYRIFAPIFRDQVRERFVVICLDSTNRAIAYRIVTEGTLNASLVHPREVFHVAIRTLAASIIIAHNHPSGNLEPSREDVQITSQIKEAGKIIDIPLHDHLIFGDNRYTSFAERGLI